MEKVGGIASDTNFPFRGSWHYMCSWGFFPVLSARLSLLLGFSGSFRHETGYGSCGWGISGSVRYLFGAEEKREAGEVVLAGRYGYCSRGASSGVSYH